MSDDASILLSCTCLWNNNACVTACDWSTVGIAVSKNTWQEARHIYKSDDRDVERVTEANKSGSLHWRVDVQAAWNQSNAKTHQKEKKKAHSELWQSCSLLTRSHFGLVTHNADSASVHPGKSHHNIFGVVRHDLKKVPLIHNLNRQNWRNCGNFQRLDDSCKFVHVPPERCPTCRMLLLTRKGRWCPTNAPGDHWQKKKVEVSLKRKKRQQVRRRWLVTWGHGIP